jgi:predicted DNA-binding transcriptional regulator AlpA
MGTRGQTVTSMPNSSAQNSRPSGLLLVGRANQFPAADVLALSIPEFCRRHGISRAHFYNLSKTGDAPAVMRVGRRTLISVEAAAEWRRRMEVMAADPMTNAFVEEKRSV